ncbi:TonB-dependent receptor domain-containing protein [Celeribacter sp.]|uniref:TonB-dependent receptor n=1 Tax=Celeribacter sp. TaxID=1890673 RepID=UPI003A945533
MTDTIRKRPTLRALALCTTAALSVTQIGWTDIAYAQAQSAEVTLSIPAQNLGSALTQLADQSGIRLILSSQIVTGKRSPALNGSYTPRSAFAALLSGSGLSYRFTSANTVTVYATNDSAAVDLPEGTLLLDTIIVSGGFDKTLSYQQPGSVNYINEDEISRFRGTNAADMLRGTPGVMSGDARNSGNGLDVNMRGMQGMDRVEVTVDGAANNVTLYQGYQGISNRSFVDPDFIAGAEIHKGGAAGSRGIAGSVEMSTVETRDIVKDGENWGGRIKLEVGGNTSTPNAGDAAGYDITNRFTVGSGAPRTSEVSSDDATMDRPSTFNPTQRAGSAIVAYEDENVELLFGAAHRERGNYHAGENGGDAAEIVDLGYTPFCYSSGVCPDGWYYENYYENQGLANYRHGEEVLNTELTSTSILAKATYKYGTGHATQLSYMSMDTEAGDRLASRLTSTSSQAVQQEQTTGAKLETFALKHHWMPSGDGAIDLTANLWHTNLKLRNPARLGYYVDPVSVGLPADFRPGSDTEMTGFDLSNSSQLTLHGRDLNLNFGLSLLHQDTRPNDGADLVQDGLTTRDGKRDEAAVFVEGDWDATEWITVKGGLRYQHFWSKDRSEPFSNNGTETNGQTLETGGWGGNLGLEVEPWKDTQFYVTYSNTQRMPSLFESLTGFSTQFNGDLLPERARTWEIGTNMIRHGLFDADDTAMFKFSYFNTDVSEYLARQYRTDLVSDTGHTYQSMWVYNLDRAKFSGLELSTHYERGGFTADFAANYYLNVQFCQTADTCESQSLYADYATNQVPPEYALSLTMSQKLMNDDLTLGGRIEHVGSRAIGHGQVTDQGLSPFITKVEWNPYTVIDVFAEYKLSEDLTASARIENLTDLYYVDPLSLTTTPAPGRTVYAGLTWEF